MPRQIPVVVYTRPRDWFDGGYTSTRMKMIYVPISGDNPVKKNGKLAGDGIGDVITSDGKQQLFKAVEQYKPDVFLHWIHRIVDRSILKRVRRLNPKIRIVVGEGNQPHNISAYVRRHPNYVDGILLNSKSKNTYKVYHKFGLNKNAVGTLYDGAKPSDHPVLDINRSYDCLFAGGCHKFQNSKIWRFPFSEWRRDFIMQVNERFNLVLYGFKDSWPIEPLMHLRYPYYFPALQNTKIILGTNHYDLERYYTRRTIHSGVSGRLFITRYIPGMEKDFTNHKNIVWFRDQQEGIEQIDYYLRHDNERENIASCQRVHFLKEHSWKKRLEQFEEYVFQLLNI